MTNSLPPSSNTDKPKLEVMPLSLQIARQLKQRREWRGLTQRELADRAGTHQATVARIEAGRANPSVELVQRLFHELNYDTTLRTLPCPYAPGQAFEMRPIKAQN